MSKKISRIDQLNRKTTKTLFQRHRYKYMKLFVDFCFMIIVDSYNKNAIMY